MNSWWLIFLISVLVVPSCYFLVYPLKVKREYKVGTGVFVLLLVVTGYWSWGSFSQWRTHQQLLKSQEQAKQLLKTIKSPQELIAKLKAKLDHSPDSAKGWYLLGRLYSSQKDEAHAVQAFAQAYGFYPKNETYAVNYAQSLWQLNHQQFNKQIVEIFTNLLTLNPNQPDALAMLAMNAYMNNDFTGAIEYWEKLLEIAPPQSQEALTIHQAIAKAQEHINNKKD